MLSYPCMPGPETPPSPEPALTRQEKENLSLKLKGRFSGIAYQAGVVDCQTLPPISPASEAPV